MSTPALVPIGTAPLPPGLRSLLVFGGTFDPPHTGHVTLPALARDALGADWLLYVPTARSPLKQQEPGAPAADRIAMLAAALRGHERVSITTIETDAATGANAAAPSYTVGTLHRLRGLLPPSTGVRLLIGADQAADFHRWRRPREILRLAEPAVMLRASRGGDAADARQELMAILAPHWSGTELQAWAGRIVPVPMIRASASEAREILRREGCESPRLLELLPRPVIDVIRARGLYRPASPSRGG